MRKWINLVEVYSEPNSYLKRFLKNTEFDYYAHWYEIAMWAEQNGHMEEFSDIIGREIEDLSDEEPEIFTKLDPDLQTEAAEWVLDWLVTNNPAELPSNHFFSPEDKLIKRTTWLIHFSDQAHNITLNGFTHGVYEPDKLGLTTYYTNDSKKHGGYNFAFEALSNDAIFAANKGKYGKHAVIFQNSGVKAWHDGDSENQIIFWGPDVHPSSIIELRNHYGDWEVVGKNRILFTGDFERVVKWVILNFHQYRRQF
jgi:hypothetical protein